MEYTYEGYTLVNNTISDNNVGILVGYCCGYAPTPFSYNNVFNNTQYNVKTRTPLDVMLSNNWWGTTDTATIEQKIYDGFDEGGLGIIFYQPILTGPVP